MSRLILDRRKLALEYVTDCLLIRSPDAPPRTLPLAHIKQLVCLHSTQVTTQLIGQLMRRGIDFIVVNQRHADHGFSLFSDHQRDATRRSLQYQLQRDDGMRLKWSRRLVRQKLKVTCRMVKDVDAAESSALHADMQRYIHKLPEVTEEATLRGIEGATQKALFAWWRQRVPAGLGFTQRRRRPPPDPVNAVLSFSYVLAHHEAVRQLKIVGLDPQLGFYHRLASGRESLACDLIEPLRPVIEAWVVGLFARKVLSRRHFSTDNGNGCRLGKQGRQIYYSELEQPQRQWRKRLAGYARVLARAVEAAAFDTDMVEESHHE